MGGGVTLDAEIATIILLDSLSVSQVTPVTTGITAEPILESDAVGMGAGIGNDFAVAGGLCRKALMNSLNR